jgi:glutamine amidotransferase
LEAEVRVTADPAVVGQADRIVLPGQGAFADCAAGLAAAPGLRAAMLDRVAAGAPFLGICVGMQLLADWGREHGDHAGLGWLPGEVVPLARDDPDLKVPHMGWNQLSLRQPHALLDGIADGAHAYFVHSFHFRPAAAASDPVCAEVGYGGWLAALVARDNLAGTQFHPEKSQAVGLRLLANFLAWRP